MWKSLHTNCDFYIVKHEYAQLKHNIHITNFVNLWHEIIDNESLIKRCRNMNKFLEAGDETFVNKTFQLLYDDNADKILTFTEEKATGSLLLRTNMEELNFSFKFELSLAAPEIMFQEVTASLLMKIQNISNVQKKLIDVIHCKDAEIDQYKIEGAVLTHKLMETHKFDDEEFIQRFSKESWPSCIKNTLEEFFENDSGISKFIEKTLGVQLNLNSTCENFQVSPDNKHSLRDSKIHSRRRIYAQHLSPSKLTYNSRVKSSQNNLPPMQVKIEDNLRRAIMKRKAIRRLL